MTFWQFAGEHPIAFVVALIVVGLTIETVVVQITHRPRRP